MKKALILFISLFISINMTAQSKKELKMRKKQEKYQIIKDLIENGKFVFEAEWATTYDGRRIYIAGDRYNLIVKSDTIQAFLPFYGRGYSAVDYGSNGGIKFKKESIQYKFSHNNIETKTNINFEVKSNAENYTIFLSVYSKGNANLSIVSNNRSTMNYDGNVVMIKEKDEKKEDEK